MGHLGSSQRCQRGGHRLPPLAEPQEQEVCGQESEGCQEEVGRIGEKGR